MSCDWRNDKMENPFLRGKMYASNDPGAIPDALSCGFTVIALVDVGSSLQYPNCAIMSSLLPPPDAINDMLNENIPLGIQKYTAYLADAAREDSIVCLLAASYQKPCDFLINTKQNTDTNRGRGDIGDRSSNLVKLIGAERVSRRNFKYEGTYNVTEDGELYDKEHVIAQKVQEPA